MPRHLTRFDMKHLQTLNSSIFSFKSLHFYVKNLSLYKVIRKTGLDYFIFKNLLVGTTCINI